MTIRVAGKHTKPKATDGHMLFNAQEMAVIANAIKGKSKVATQFLRQAFAMAGVKPRCLPRQLRDFVKNFNKKMRSIPASAEKDLPIEVLRQHVQQWKRQQASWDKCEISDLLLLDGIREPIVSEAQVYIPFSCKGMLSRLQYVRKH